MRNTLSEYSRSLFTGIFFAGIFVFFSFFYNNHLHFEEQSRLFLLTKDFFINKIRFPGGFSGYTGGFISQFYYISYLGPALIVFLLWALQAVFFKMLEKINPDGSFYLLSFLPSLNCAMILCDEFYPLSAVTGLLTALIINLIYFNILKKSIRFTSGLLFVIITYWLTGGSFITFLFTVIVFELAGRFKDRGVNYLNIWQLSIFLLAGLGFPLLIRSFVIMEPTGLAYFSEFYYNIRTTLPLAIPLLLLLPPFVLLIFSLLPSTLNRKLSLTLQIALLPLIIYFGFSHWVNFNAESIMKYDYLVRSERWNDVIKLAEKDPPRNNLALAMLNLALAKSDKMGDLLFKFEQNGEDGLFLPFEREFIAPLMGSDILFSLGLINASQEYSFESMETIPDYGKSSRCIKRLAETNLINGHYEVSAKYLLLLKKTIFYRKWADETWKYLYNEELINNHPIYGELRKMMLGTDVFFKIQNMESALNMLMKENTGNKIAFQYLMSYYLLNKDLKNFMGSLPLMDHFKYSAIPVAYQEAVMYVIGLTTKDPISSVPPGITSETSARMKAYADIYTTNPNARNILAKKFSGTYWFYLHYKKLKVND